MGILCSLANLSGKPIDSLTRDVLLDKEKPLNCGSDYAVAEVFALPVSRLLCI